MSLSLEINADVTGLNASFSQAKQSLLTFSQQAISTGSNIGSRISSSFSAIGRSVQSAVSSMAEVGKELENVGGKLSLSVSAPLALIATSALKASSQFEQVKISFETTLGSMEKATYLVEAFQEQASKSPLENKDIQNAGALLLNFGVAGNKVLGITKMLGDVSQGNSERFKSLSLAFAQVSAGGKLMGNDMLQFINAGFNPLQVISQKTGESMGSLRKRMSDGKIGIAEVEKAFVDATSKGGRFYQASEKQSKTLGGLYSSMQDSITKSLVSLGDSIAQALNLKELIPKISSFVSSIADSFNSLSPSIKSAIIVFGALLAVIPPILLALGVLTTTVIPAIVAGFALISAPVLAVGAVVVGFAYLVATNFDKIKSYMLSSGIWNALQNIVKNTLGVITGIFKIFMGAVTGIWNYGMSVVKKDTFGIFSAITGIFADALNLISSIVGVFSNLLQGNWRELGSSLFDVIKSVFNGIITATTLFMRVFIGVFAKPFEWLGMEKVSKAMLDGANKLQTQMNGFKFQIGDKNIDLPKPKASAKKVIDLGDEKPVKRDEDEKAKEKAKAHQEKINDTTEKLQRELQSTRISLFKEGYEKEYLLEAQRYANRTEDIQKEIADEKTKNALLLAEEASHQQKIDELKIKFQSPLKTKNLGGVSANSVTGQMGSIQTSFGSSISAIDNLTQKMESSMAKFTQATNKGKMATAEVLKGLNESLNTGLNQATASAIIGMSSMVYGIASGAVGFKEVGAMLLGMIGDVFSQMGEQFILAGVNMLLLEPLLTNPFTSGFALIAAGAGLVALGGIASGIVSSGGKSSSGGGGSSYSGSSSFSNTGGDYLGQQGYFKNFNPQSSNVEVTGKFELKGADLVATVNRTTAFNKRNG